MKVKASELNSLIENLDDAMQSLSGNLPSADMEAGDTVDVSDFMDDLTEVINLSNQLKTMVSVASEGKKLELED